MAELICFVAVQLRNGNRVQSPCHAKTYEMYGTLKSLPIRSRVMAALIIIIVARTRITRVTLPSSRSKSHRAWPLGFLAYLAYRFFDKSLPYLRLKMGEHDTLEALGVQSEWIWGNDLETIVFAQVFGHGKTLIFRFTQDRRQHPQSLTTRIVNCYHDLTVDSASATFSDRPSMRTAIWSAIAAVWAKCSEQPAIKDPDVIIDVYDTGSTDLPSRITWSICHDDIFTDFIDLLLPPSQLLVKQPMDTVDFTSLTRLGQLGGRGCTTLVQTVSNPKSQFVFKGI